MAFSVVYKEATTRLASACIHVLASPSIAAFLRVGPYDERKAVNMEMHQTAVEAIIHVDGLEK